MPINMWKMVEYTDDGCSVYQCLQCGQEWEGRSSPGYTSRETLEYTPRWKFCPYCGVEWLKQAVLSPEKRRIRDAMDLWESDRLWDREKPPEKQWRFEVKTSNGAHWFCFESKPLYYKREEILRALKIKRESRSEEIRVRIY